MIEAAMADAQRPALALSGGKDSLLLLALCKPYRKRLHVVWARTSETFPHMVDFMREATRGWDFQELVSDQSAYFATHGFPSALIPVRHRPHEKNPGILIQSNGYCCKALQYKPLARYLKEYGADLVLHGQTAEDLLNHKTSFPAMLGPLSRLCVTGRLRRCWPIASAGVCHCPSNMLRAWPIRWNAGTVPCALIWLVFAGCRRITQYWRKNSALCWDRSMVRRLPITKRTSPRCSMLPEIRKKIRKPRRLRPSGRF